VQIAQADVTGVTSLSGTELVTNGTFDTDTTGWSQSSSTLSVDSNRLKITNSTTVKGWAIQGFATTIGKTYVITFTGTFGNTGFGYWLGTSSKGSQYTSNSGWAGEKSLTFTATATTAYISFRNGGSAVGEYSFVDGVTCKEAIPDRSVKGNGLAVYGTLTLKDPDGTTHTDNDKLACISGFSSSNYLEQTGFDTPTGDMSIMFWTQGGGGDEEVLSISDSDVQSPSNGIHIWLYGSQLKVMWGSKYYNSAVGSAPYNTMQFYTLVQNGNSLECYINGKIAVTSTKANNITDTLLKIGEGYYGGSVDKIALPRISATAPTAEQILEIYNAEKPLFQDNAKCTLNGTSDAVTAMSYDDSNEELLVGTSGGLSVFKGLRRVDENTNNITEVAQQGSLRVEEY
jgi:hypothetical protein